MVSRKRKQEGRDIYTIKIRHSYVITCTRIYHNVEATVIMYLWKTHKGLQLLLEKNERISNVG